MMHDVSGIDGEGVFIAYPFAKLLEQRGVSHARAGTPMTIATTPRALDRSQGS